MYAIWLYGLNKILVNNVGMPSEGTKKPRKRGSLESKCYNF